MCVFGNRLIFQAHAELELSSVSALGQSWMTDCSYAYIGRAHTGRDAQAEAELLFALALSF